MSKRYIEINNDELKALVEKKGEIVDQGRAHYAEMEELHAKGNKISEERNSVVEEILKLTGECLKDQEIDEFEVASTTDIKDGVVRVEIIDTVAQYKDNYRTRKEQEERKASGEMTVEEQAKQTNEKIMKAMQSIDPEKLNEKLEQILEVLNK